jgi:hypothetical protein
MLGVHRHHATLAGTEFKRVVTKFHGEVAAPDNDRFGGMVVVIPAALTAARHAHHAHVDPADRHGLLACPLRREAREGCCKID